MTSEQFTYWLQGYVELNGTAPTEAQWASIKEHLQLVFKKETSPYVWGTQQTIVPNSDFTITC